MASERPLQSVRQVSTMVDTCVLLDILTDEAQWADWSAEAVAGARDVGNLVINPIIYAEVCAGFERIEDVEAALPASDFLREALPYPAGFLASRAFVTYRRQGGLKSSPLPDFYIGAHAAVNRYRLVTRDTARFQTYFPTIELVTPN